MTDTPETDAAAFEASFNVAGNIERDMVVSAVVARRLERERDIAKKLLVEITAEKNVRIAEIEDDAKQLRTELSLWLEWATIHGHLYARGIVMRTRELLKK